MDGYFSMCILTGTAGTCIIIFFMVYYNTTKGDKLMPVYQDKNKKYYVSKSYIDPLTGYSKNHCKRGFNTMRDAKKYESKFDINLRCAQSTNYKVDILVEMYLEYKKERVNIFKTDLQKSL